MRAAGFREKVFGLKAFAGDMEVEQQGTWAVVMELYLHFWRGMSSTGELLVLPWEHRGTLRQS